MLSDFATRYWVACLSLIFLTISLLGRTGQKTDGLIVPVDDETGAGSPVEISGQVTFVETIVANQVTSSRSESIRAKNSSDKPILFLIGSFHAAGPKSSEEDAELVIDNFFHDKNLSPGESVVLLERPSGEHYISEPFRTPLDEERPPKAEFHLLFVQFSDGSTFGASTEAKKWLDSRRSTLSLLKKLRRVYDQGGEAAFLQTLEREGATIRPTSLYSQIRELQRTGGAKAAVTSIDRTIVVASQHESALIRK